MQGPLEKTNDAYAIAKINGIKIVGIVEIIKEHFLDKTDKTYKFVSVAVKSLGSFKKPVKLAEIKKSKDFVDLTLVKQSRLSVMEIDLKSWKKICKMGKV